MQLINLDKLRQILGKNNDNEFLFYDDCDITDSGIYAKSLDSHSKGLLIGDKLNEWEDFTKAIRLILPCTYFELVQWMKKNGFDSVLKTTDHSKHNKYLSDFNKKYKAQFGSSFWSDKSPSGDDLIEINCDNQTLLDNSIQDLIEENNLTHASEFNYFFSLFTWRDQLTKEKLSITPELYQNKKDFDDRVSALNNKIKEINWYLEDINTNPQANNTLEVSYGEDELQDDDAIGLYPSLILLANNWTSGEFALQLLNNRIKAFKDETNSSMYKQAMNISQYLHTHGKAETFSNELVNIDNVLLNFKYSKAELTKFNPDFRYISFNQAKELVSKKTKGLDSANNFLLHVINNNELIPWYPLIGAIAMEQSLDGKRWQHCFFEDWQLGKVIENEFGCSTITNISIENGLIKPINIPNKNQKKCGRNAIHKLIERAFYSIDLPINNVTPKTVMLKIKDERKNSNEPPIIDTDSIIESINNNTISWKTTTGNPATVKYKRFGELVNSLKPPK